MPLERRFDGKSFGDNDSQRFMDIHETPWIDAVERVMGTAPSNQTDDSKWFSPVRGTGMDSIMDLPCSPGKVIASRILKGLKTYRHPAASSKVEYSPVSGPSRSTAVERLE